MYIQPVTQRPNFKGKVVFCNEINNAKPLCTFAQIDKPFKQIANMIQDKPYDVFISRNKQNPDFFDVAANITIEDAKKTKGYTVKVQSDILASSVVDAAKDAIDMYEKYIAKGFRG